MRRVLASTALVLTIFVGGCATTNEPLVDQFGEGDGQNYISGDGSITVLAREARQDSISFSGPLDTGGTFESSDYKGNVLVVNFFILARTTFSYTLPAHANSKALPSWAKDLH